MKVFLGGTVADSTWRDELISQLEIDYFNPIVQDWNDAAHQREQYEREQCDFNLYVITPKMIGYYSIAEVMDDAMKKSDQTIYCFLREDENCEFSPSQIISLENVGKRATKYGAIWARSLSEVAAFLNYAGIHHGSEKTNEQIKEEADYYDAFTKVDTATKSWKASKMSKSALWTGIDLSSGLIAWRRLRHKPEVDLPDLSSEMEQFVEACVQNQTKTRKVSLFISYSRDPSSALARQLYNQLKDKYEVWFDKVSIPHGEDFRSSIEKGVRHCDNFIYIITKNAVESPYCAAELDLAKSYGKRVIPIQQEKVGDDEVDKDIKDINRITFESKESQWDLDTLQQQIEKVSKVAPEIVVRHTQFLARAVEWTTEEFNPRMLLHGDLLIMYEQWSHDLQEAKLKTNPVTKWHKQLYAESRAFHHLGYREIWIAGYDEEVLHSIRSGFTTNTNPIDPSPESLLKSAYFLFLVTKESVIDTVLSSQLAMARDHTIPVIFFLLQDVVLPQGLKPEEHDIVINSISKPSLESIRQLKAHLIKKIGPRFDYFKTPSLLTINAYEWHKRNRQASNLLRGRCLSYFQYYQQTYELDLTEKTKAYFDASLQVQEHTPYDVFVCCEPSKLNFSFWLGGQLLSQKLTSWNHHAYIIKDKPEEHELIMEGIKLSQNFVIILSSSKNILEDRNIVAQIQTAKDLKKRIFLVQNDGCKEPEELSLYPKIDFSSKPEQATFELIEDLTTDRDFIKFFNEVYPIALQWDDAQGKSKSDLLLGGFPLDDAENKLKGHEEEVPEVFRAFLTKSREKSNHNKFKEKRTKAFIVLLAVIASIVAIIAAIQSGQAKIERNNARLSQIDATIEKINAQDSELEAQEALKKEQIAQLIAEKRRIQADSSAEAALCLKYEADSSAQVASANAIKALIARNRADSLKRIARRENRLSTSLINSYQVRSTDNNLLDTVARTKAIQAYFFHKNDKGHNRHDPDIFTALFKVANAPFIANATNIIQTLPHYTNAYKPFAFDFYPGGRTLYILSENGTNTIITTQETLLTPSVHYQIDHLIGGGQVSPDGRYFWTYSDKGLGRVDLSTGDYFLVFPSENIEHLAIAPMPRREVRGGQIFLDEYIIASRSSREIRLFKFEKDGLTQIHLIAEPTPYAYPKAMDIYGSYEGYLLAIGRGEQITTLRGKRMSPPLEERSSITRITSTSELDAQDQITCLKLSGLNMVVGTEQGKIALGQLNLWKETSLQSFAKAKSSIRKVSIDNVFYTAVTHGNQSEQAKVILNTLKNEKNESNDNGIDHVERKSDDIINDIAIVGSNLYYIENNLSIRYHTLRASKVINSICHTLQNCQEESEIFNSYYEEESQKAQEQNRKLELEFCECEEVKG